MVDDRRTKGAHASEARFKLDWKAIVYWLALALLAALYLMQMLSFEPTSDPDPDGYVTYANHLREHGTILDFRRLPGYPAFIMLVDGLSSAAINIDVYFAQIVLSVALLLTMSVMVLRFFGRGPSLLFAAIIAIQSLFAFISTIMLADFLSALIAQLLLLIGVLFFKSRRWWIPVLLAAFFVVSFVGIAVHSSLFWAVICFYIGATLVWLTDRLSPWKFVSEVFRRTGLQRIGALAVASVAAYLLAFSTLVVHLPNGQASTYERFYSGISTYVMVLCLPPARAAGDPVDAAVQEVKAQISAEQGFPVERTRFPSFKYDLWGALVDRHPEINTEYWHERALKHPFSFIGCAYNEIQSRYHDLLWNFSPFSSKRELVNYHRPAFNTYPANKLYWMTGIYARPMNEQATMWDNMLAYGTELFRVLAVIALIFGGALVMARRYPELAIASLLGTLGWMVVASTQLVLDARYLIVWAPFIYLCEALAIWWVVAKAIKLVTGRFGRGKPAPVAATTPAD